MSLGLLGVLIGALGVILTALGAYYQRRATQIAREGQEHKGLGEWFQAVCARCGLPGGPVFIEIGHAAGAICRKCGARLVFLPSEDGLRCTAYVDDGHGDGRQTGPVLITPRLPLLFHVVPLLRRILFVGAYPEGRRADYEQRIWLRMRRRRGAGLLLVLLGISLVLVASLAGPQTIITLVILAAAGTGGYNAPRVVRPLRRRRLALRPAVPGQTDMPDDCWLVVVVLPPDSVPNCVVGVPLLLTATGTHLTDVSVQVSHGSHYAGGESLVPKDDLFASTHISGTESITDYRIPAIPSGGAVGLMKPIRIRRADLAEGAVPSSLDRVHIFASSRGRRRASESFWLATVVAGSLDEVEAHFEGIVRAVMQREGPRRVLAPVAWWSRRTQGNFEEKQCLIIRSHLTTDEGADVAVDGALRDRSPRQTEYVPAAVELFVRTPPAQANGEEPRESAGRAVT